MYVVRAVRLTVVTRETGMGCEKEPGNKDACHPWTTVEIFMYNIHRNLC